MIRLNGQTTSNEDSLECLTPNEFKFYAKAVVDAEALRVKNAQLKDVIGTMEENAIDQAQLLRDQTSAYNACNTEYIKYVGKFNKVAYKLKRARNGCLILGAVGAVVTGILILK